MRECSACLCTFVHTDVSTNCGLCPTSKQYLETGNKDSYAPECLDRHQKQCVLLPLGAYLFTRSNAVRRPCACVHRMTRLSTNILPHLQTLHPALKKLFRFFFFLRALKWGHPTADLGWECHPPHEPQNAVHTNRSPLPAPLTHGIK